MTTGTPETTLEQAVEAWRSSAQGLLAAAGLIAPLATSDIANLQFDGEGLNITGPASAEAVLDARAQQVIDNADDVIGRIPQAAAGTNRVADDAMPTLLGVLQLGQTLLVASEEPTFAVQALRNTNLDSSAALVATVSEDINQYALATLGQAPTVPVAVPKEVEDALEKLEDEGADKLFIIGENTVLMEGLGWAAGKVVDAAPGQVQDAVKWLRQKLGWVKGIALKLIKWVIEKLRSMLPKALQEKFDEKLKDLKDKLTDGIKDKVGDLVGEVYHRGEIEDKWKAATEAQQTAAKAGLEGVLETHVTRLGYVKKAGKYAGTAAEVITSAFDAVGMPVQAKVVLAGLATLMAGFTFAQVWDGNHDIGDLIPAA